MRAAAALVFALASVGAFIAFRGESRFPPAAPTSTTPTEPSAPSPEPSSARRGKAAFASRRIDFHTHIHPLKTEHALALMDRYGIGLAVNLSNKPAGPSLAAVLRLHRQHGVRVVTFAALAWEHLLRRDPDFGEKMAENVRLAAAQGAKGLKIPKALGLMIPDPSGPEGALLRVDDDRLAPVFEAAADTGLPVAIHVGDPVAFWSPPTPDNERYSELKGHPGWSYAGRDVPSHAELMAQQRALFLRHPRTSFVGVHVAGFPEDLAWVDALLREAPNVYVDIAARIPEIGRGDPAKVRAFFERHQDRVLFGTDLGVNPDSLMLGAPLAWREGPADVDRFFISTWRFLETHDRDFEHPTPIQGEWTISGVGLDDKVLEKVYVTNAARLLGLEPR